MNYAGQTITVQHSGLSRIFAGRESANFFGVANSDPHHPDVFGIAQVGTIYTTGSKIGKLVVPDQIQDHIMHSGVRILGLAPNHGLEVARLPMHHRDPFDRLLIAQARSEQVTIVTADVRIADYDVLTIDAST